MKKFSLLFLIAISLQSFSQNEKIDRLLMDYTNHFSANPETIYTHLNKSHYFQKENLWFKAYIFDTKTQNPYLKTTNVYATVYDEKGNFKEQKLFHATEGMTHGNFALDNNYVSGIYYLKLTTNWMRNFDEKFHSVQQFEIIGNETGSNDNKPSTPSYDFQLLPEGGQLLQNVINTIGFKVINQYGNGVKANSGSVSNSKNDIVYSFKGNELGMGKFEVKLEEQESYNVSVMLEDGTVLKQPIEKIQKSGIALTVNNLNPDKLIVQLKTNAITLPQIIDDTYYLVIHRDGMIKKIDVNFKQEQLDYIVPISKSELYSGISILTLFNNKNQPLLERLVYNNTNTPIEKINLLNFAKLEDSIQIRFRSEKNDTIQKYISVSVLPSSTKAYDFDSNIQSAFLLAPYVKGHIENADYYFNNINRKTEYDLDLLLLTQGWSSYSWNSIFFSTPTFNFSFDKGIDLKGTLNSGTVDDASEVVLFSPDNGLILTSLVDENNKFSFENLFIADSSSIGLSVRNKKNQLSYPSLYYHKYPNPKKDNISTENFAIKKHMDKEVSTGNVFIYEDAVKLDEVVLEAKMKNTIILGSYNPKKIDLESGSYKSSRILDIISYNGFNVSKDSTGSLTILTTRELYYNKRTSPRVYLDNMEITDFLEELLFLYAEDVEELFISKSPSVISAGGNIHVFRKKSFKSAPTKSSFNNSIISFGFTKPQNYYSPRYNNANLDMFYKYGVIHWIPDLKANDQNEFVFKIPSYSDGAINLHINGMTLDGRLISTTETIDLAKNDK